MDNEKSKRKFHGRGFTSLLLTGLFLVASVTGIVLYFTPKGRVAHWTNWTMLGLDKEQWSAVHMNVCLLFLILAIIHLVYNWRVFFSYIKKKAVAGMNLKFELAAAVLITVLVVAGTLWHVPPFSYVVELNDSIKVHWAAQAQGAPAPHAEDFSLKRYARQVNLEADDVKKALVEEGYQVDGLEITIKELAAQKGIAPSDVHAAVIKHFPEAVQVRGQGRGKGQGMRQGRGMGQGQGMGRGRANQTQ